MRSFHRRVFDEVWFSSAGHKRHLLQYTVEATINGQDAMLQSIVSL
ncbi:MAG: hypothetical protein JW863_06865 [Chitinispirillaceae bacterium]|nr:hypothetical protein [Chitinispirillaceae bacterium]